MGNFHQQTIWYINVPLNPHNFSFTPKVFTLFCVFLKTIFLCHLIPNEVTITFYQNYGPLFAAFTYVMTETLIFKENNNPRIGVRRLITYIIFLYLGISFSLNFFSKDFLKFLLSFYQMK